MGQLGLLAAGSEALRAGDEALLPAIGLADDDEAVPAPVVKGRGHPLQGVGALGVLAGGADSVGEEGGQRRTLRGTEQVNLPAQQLEGLASSCPRAGVSLPAKLQRHPPRASRVGRAGRSSGAHGSTRRGSSRQMTADLGKQADTPCRIRSVPGATSYSE